MINKVLVHPKGKPSYDIVISEKIDFSYLIPYSQNKQVLVVTNKTVAPLYLKMLSQAIQPYTKCLNFCILEDGEMYKSAKSLDKIYEVLLENNYTRKCVLIALGGGVVGDITGFAAATYQRGVEVLQVPTTLLAQVDSSVGGKTAINHRLGKNMIGAFFQPKIVYTATEVLKTLPKREFIAGLAEVIKYGCIIDEAFFYWLKSHHLDIMALTPDTISQMIAKSCAIKAKVVAMDEMEATDIRALLNLGHTFGHGIECYQQYHGLRHGEAVGVGIAIAAKFSHYLGYINQSTVDEIVRLLQLFSVPTDLPEDIKPSALIAAMKRDKKNMSDNITFVLLDKIGQAKVDRSISLDMLQTFLQDNKQG
ncbi:3-dehydroquinate synthase [Facilibium subflavum]|uniref:3-dehydroquinate synthase n=1 Tax=Facilibium subflavum TaxID=2219058 RepID=UPI001F41CB7B|nr:3-dehydroquinate synthase [Facilibium subflavum]